MRGRGTIALVVLFALGACASTASAAPLSMTFAEGRANVGVQLSDEALFAAPATAPFEAQINPVDPANEEITAGSLEVPAFSTHITEPIDADVTVDFEIGEIEGNFAWAVGVLTLKGKAGGTLTATNETYDGEECEVSTTPEVLELSTATAASAEGAPRSGERFIRGLAGAGAIAGEWTHMDAEPVEPGNPDNVSFCKNVEQQIGGKGGVWLEQEDIVPPSPPLFSAIDPPSPNSNGTPRITGVAEPESTVSLYAGPSCAGAPIAAEKTFQLGLFTFFPAVAEGVIASFSATATDAAGNTSACSAPVAYERLRSDPPPPPPVCVVPKLAGKTPKAAKKKIRAANCVVGKVSKPKRPKGHKGRWILVVKSSNPRAGSKPANGKVHLRLGPK
ncbi:MAG: hypothetical protein M3Y75_09865 [Actinomycetota bacterium]|nr:hypothetical protein [Actinomycetota bacterium]